MYHQLILLSDSTFHCISEALPYYSLIKLPHLCKINYTNEGLLYAA